MAMIPCLAPSRKEGKVYGFDIQSIAINRTWKLLTKNWLAERVILIEDGHENIGNHIKDKIHLAVYNLGYLPGGDKRIITTPFTSLESIAKTLSLLHSNGILLITCYTGHPGGLTEKKEIEKFLGALDQRKFNVLEFKFINQKNNPPILYGIEKL